MGVTYLLRCVKCREAEKALNEVFPDVAGVSPEELLDADYLLDWELNINEEKFHKWFERHKEHGRIVFDGEP